MRTITAPIDSQERVELDRRIMMRIDVPRELAACVRSLGGVVSDDSPDPHSLPNADYWFPTDQVVSELKCLSENLLDKKKFKARTQEMYLSWIARKLLPPCPRVVVPLNLEELPRTCALELLGYLKRRFESNTVAKAGAQIKATKERLAAPTAKGLLLLASDGDYALTPSMIAYLFSHMRRDENTSLNSLVYFSENELMTIPGVPGESRLWMEAVVPGREPVSSDFLARLRSAWFDHCSRLAPSDARHVMIMPSDPATVHGIRFRSGP